MKQIKWVLAHEPIELFIRAAKVFAAEVEANAPGQLSIEVMTMSEYSNKYNNNVLVTKHELVDLLDSGKIDIMTDYNNDTKLKETETASELKDMVLNRNRQLSMFLRGKR